MLRSSTWTSEMTGRCLTHTDNGDGVLKATSLIGKHPSEYPCLLPPWQLHQSPLTMHIAYLIIRWLPSKGKSEHYWVS